MAKVQEFVTKKITQITKIMNAEDHCFDYVQLRGSNAEGLKIVDPDEFDYVLADTSDKDKIFFNEKKAPTGFAYAILKGKGAGCLDK